MAAPSAAPSTSSSSRSAGLPDDGKTILTITEVPVRKIDVPESDFYAKRLDYRGLPIKAADVVSDAAFYAAWRRLDRLLSHNPVILDNLLRARSEVHIIGKDQVQTDLPELRSQKGVPLRENPRITLDERARGMGGRHCSVGEENLLELPNDRYRGRDILSHELTHTIHHYGISPNVNQRVTATYRAAREKHLWETPSGIPAYAGTNEKEYLAELALWWVGGHGDWPRTMATRLETGQKLIARYDPEGFKLIDDLFNGRADVQPVSSPRALASPPRSEW
jgi:alpha-glucosidase